MRPLALALAVLALAAAAGRAHPVPKDNHDRTIVVYLTPDAVIVDYRVELDSYRLYRDLDGVDLKRSAGEDVHDAYLRHFAPALMGNLVAKLDGAELAFECLRKSFRVLDHVRCDYRFRARWRLSSDKAHSFTFTDANFHGDISSAVHLALDASSELTLTGVVAPDDALLAKPSDRLAPGERDRLTSLKAMVRAVPSFQAGVVRPALPPDADPVRPAARGRAGRTVATSKPVPNLPIGEVKPNAPPAESAASRPRWLDVLFDTRHGLGVLLLIFAGFGAGHALTPGHGKTLVAAYLVGERGTVWHALVLGVVTTMTHTGVILVVALALPLLFPDAPPATVQLVLGLVGGLLIAGVGLWLLMQRLAGRADHVHIGGGHSHSHGADDAPPPPGWWGVIALGVSGGIVPCWDAILIPAVCVAARRPELAWPLVLAFSAGLAGVLVALGIAVVRAREMAGGLLESGRARAVTRLLPIGSAAVIVVLGLWLCWESVRLVA